MTEQERPRTEAGSVSREVHNAALRAATKVGYALGLAEGRQQAEGDWVGPFDGLSLQRHYNPATGKLWHYDDCPDEDHRFDLHAILDRVAGLNASESPPTHNHPSVGFDEACPACQENLRVAASKWVGDASESGQPPGPAMSDLVESRRRLERFVQRVKDGWSARGAIGLEDDQFARDVNALLGRAVQDDGLQKGASDEH